jgi:hypothetical protein
MADSPRRGGRPTVKSGEPSTPVTVRVGTSDYDRAYSLAQRRRVSVPAVFRAGLHRVLRDTNEDDDDD